MNELEALGDPGAQELLDSQPLMRMAYAGLDGFPRVVPVGFVWREWRIIVCTATTAPKVRALSTRPGVALSIDTDSLPPRALLVRGVATIEVVDGVPEEYIAASTKAMDGDELRDFEAQVRSVYRQMARISIKPHWARYYDFGSGRLPVFLTRLLSD